MGTCFRRNEVSIADAFRSLDLYFVFNNFRGIGRTRQYHGSADTRRKEKAKVSAGILLEVFFKMVLVAHVRFTMDD